MTKLRPTVDLGYPTERHGRIPAFNTVEEEAEFWDTHDITDYLDDLEPVELVVDPALGHLLTVRLDAAEIGDLDRHAAERGTNVAALARAWILERLRAEAALPVPTP